MAVLLESKSSEYIMVDRFECNGSKSSERTRSKREIVEIRKIPKHKIVFPKRLMKKDCRKLYIKEYGANKRAMRKHRRHRKLSGEDDYACHKQALAYIAFCLAEFLSDDNEIE